MVVVDVSRRNRAFQVTEGSRGFHLKCGTGADGLAALVQEARVLRFLGEHLPPSLASRLPRLLEFDSEYGILLQELIPQARHLREHQEGSGRFSSSPAADLARFLAGLHSLAPTAASAVAPSVEVSTRVPGRLELTTERPWVLSLHRPELKTVHGASGAQLDVLRMLQRATGLGAVLDELRRTWKPRRLVHNDLRWDNCLVAGSRSRGRPSLRIVDWELAGLGDPLWDLGCALSEYLRCWVLSIPPVAGLSRAPALAWHPLVRMQAAMCALWETYGRGARLRRSGGERRLVRTTRYAAARLVQIAFEAAGSQSAPSIGVVRLLQLASNVAARPVEAAQRLMGIQPPAAVPISSRCRSRD